MSRAYPAEVEEPRHGQLRRGHLASGRSNRREERQTGGDDRVVPLDGAAPCVPTELPATVTSRAASARAPPDPRIPLGGEADRARDPARRTRAARRRCERSRALESWRRRQHAERDCFARGRNRVAVDVGGRCARGL